MFCVLSEDFSLRLICNFTQVLNNAINSALTSYLPSCQLKALVKHTVLFLQMNFFLQR